MLFQRRSLVDSVVAAQVEDEDVLFRIETGSPDLAINRLLAAVDGLVLVVHDGASACRCVVAKITSETRNGWDDDDNTELATLLGSANASISNRTTDLVVHRCLLLPGGSNEELVFNVHEMLGTANDLTVRVLDALLRENSTGPIG